MGDDSETFDGTLKSYNDKNGFGFIECQTTKLKYGCDVFVHKTEGESVSVGSRVTFKVHLNKKGQPQANNLVAVAHNNLFKVEPGLQQTGDIQSAGSDGLSGPFLGRVKSNNPVNGYGFITCEETQAIYKADVYLNQTEGHGLEPGQEVYFQVQRNQQGKPQAVGVSVVSKKTFLRQHEHRTTTCTDASNYAHHAHAHAKRHELAEQFLAGWRLATWSVANWVLAT